MALDERSVHHDKIPGDKFVNPIADYEMRSWDYVVRPSAGVYSGPIVITLPRVAEARGRLYSILIRDADTVNTVTITDHDDAECWIADIVFDGKCDGCLFYSDGLAWFPLELIQEWPGMATTPPPGVTTEPPTTAPG